MATIRDTYELLGIDKTKKAFKSAQSNSAKFTSGLRAAGVAFTALSAGAGILTGIALEAAKTADQMQKLVDRLGGTTEGFSTLRFAAELTGVEFQQASTGVQRMTRRLAQAAQGTGEAVDAFDQLGISAEKLVQLPIEKQLAVIAEQLSKVDNQSTKVALAQKIFDSEAVKLLQTLKGGAAGLQEYARTASELGAVVGKDLATSSVVANEGLTKLKFAGEGLANSLGRQLLPAIGVVAEFLADTMVSAANTAGSVFTELSAFIIRMVADFKALDAVLTESAATAARFVGLDSLADDLDEMGAAARAASLDTAQWAQFTAEGSAATKDAQEVADLFKISIEEVAGRTLSAAAKEKARKDGLKALKSETVELTAAQKAYNEIMEEGARITESLRTPTEVLADTFKELNDLQLAGAITQETYLRGVTKAQDEFDKTREKIAETSKEMSTFADEAGRNIQDSLADFLFDPFQDGLDGMLSGFTDMLRRMAAEAAASQILDSFGGASGVGGFIGSIFGARANGGPVPAGAPMLVGERGPEIFTPSTNGSITPNGAGGGAVNVTVNMNGPTQGGRATANQIAAQVGGAVREAQARLR